MLKASLTPETTSLREQKKEETRRALADAAMTILSRDGLAGMTVAAVAHEARVSVRTFHNYFPSVQAALDTSFARLMDELIEYVNGIDEEVDTVTAFGMAVRQGMLRIVNQWGVVATDRFHLKVDVGCYLVAAGYQQVAVGNSHIDRLRHLLADRESRLQGKTYTSDHPRICLIIQLCLGALRAALDSCIPYGSTNVAPDVHKFEEVLNSGIKCSCTVRKQATENKR